MKIKYIKDESFSDYKNPAMFINTCYCDFKCCKEQNLPITVCQNYEWNDEAIINMPDEYIIERYLHNNITSAIVFGGLEPLLQTDELIVFISKLREEYSCDDPVVIYTGYNSEEIPQAIKNLSKYKNIIIKYSRYIPNQSPHYDEVLGIYLASDNQYAVELTHDVSKIK